jgi:protein subunit release factor A
LSIERKDIKVRVYRELYDESDPLKIRESIVSVKHIPTGIISVKRNMIQIVAFYEALKDIENKLNKN